MSKLRSAFAVTMTTLLMLLPALTAYGQADEAEPVEYEYFVVVSKFNSSTGEWDVVPPKRGPYSRQEAIDVAKELQAEFPATQFYSVEIKTSVKVPETDGGNNEPGFRVIVRKKNPVTLVWDVVYRSEPFDGCVAAEAYAATLLDDFPSPMYRILTPDVCNDDDDTNDGGDDTDNDNDNGNNGNGGGDWTGGLFGQVLTILAIIFAFLSGLFQ